MRQPPRHVHRFAYALSGCAILFFLTITLTERYLASPARKSTTPLSAEEVPNFIRARMEHCYENAPRNPCYHQAAIDFLDRLSLNQILKVFGTYEKNTEFFTQCHEVAHYLGQEAYRRTKNVREVFKESSYACLAGVFHGAVEGYFMEKGLLGANDADYAKEVPNVCGKQEEYQIPQQFVECNHGMGHAVMFLTENDLIRALALCDALITLSEQELCYTGAFMANTRGTADTDHPSKYLPKPEDPLYPCPLLDHRYQGQCYSYGILESFQGSTERSTEACKLIPREYQEACFRTLGRNKTMYSADPLVLKEHCEQIPETNFQYECIKGVAYNLVIRFGPLSPLPDQFCTSVNMEAQQGCLLEIQSARKITSQRENN